MPQKKSLKSLEARVDAQLRDFGYGPVGEEEQRGTSLPRMAVRGAAAGAGVAGLGAAVMNRKKIAQGVGSGMEKAGGYMRNQGVLTKNIKAGRVMGDIGKKIISGGKKLQGFENVGEIIELAERVAELELEEEREFGSVDQLTRRGQGMAASVMNKKGSGMGKLGKVIKANPRTAAAIGATAVAGGALAKKSHDKTKRREELVARFKGGAANAC